MHYTALNLGITLLPRVSQNANCVIFSSLNPTDTSANLFRLYLVAVIGVINVQPKAHIHPRVFLLQQGDYFPYTRLTSERDSNPHSCYLHLCFKKLHLDDSESV